MSKFEDRTNAFAEGRKTGQQLLQSNILNSEIVRQLTDLGINNPYFSMLYFVKGELKDIKAI